MQNTLTPTLFGLQDRTRVVAGPGVAAQTGSLVRELGVRRVLLVTDPGIVAAGHAGMVFNHLEAAGLSVAMYDKARENPTTKDVEECVEEARAAQADAIVGLGGGSSMDTAKGCNFIVSNGGRMQDYWGVGKALMPMLPFVAIPTTSGTGSELQSAALIADEQTHQKMACLDPKCAARLAILDPLLTASQPPRVTACTGIDAIAHAVETAVTIKRTELSQKFSHAAFTLCFHSLPQVLAQPGDLEARARMQLGAAYAGAAIESSMLGAAHAAANPLTAHFGVVHGHAVGLMLPHIVRFNAVEAEPRELYTRLAAEAGLVAANGNAAEELASRLQRLLITAGLPRTLQGCGVKRSAIPALADEAARQWTATFNPRAISAGHFIWLYEAAFA